MRQIPFLVGLHRMTTRDVSPQMLLVLYTIRAHPGGSYSDVTAKLGHAVNASIYKSVRHLIVRGMVDDRRDPNGHPKSPGVLHATPAGIEFLKDVLDGNDGS